MLCVMANLAVDVRFGSKTDITRLRKLIGAMLLLFRFQWVTPRPVDNTEHYLQVHSC